jgi:hypothetical protein
MDDKKEEGMGFRQKVVRGWLGVFAVSALLFAAVGCDNSDSSGNVTGPQANLVVTFTPNPTSHSAYGEWLYRVEVTETNGVGVNIYGWTRTGYSAAGVEYLSEVKEEVDFIGDFDACGGEGNYIGGGQTRCSNRHLFDERSGWQIFTFYGVDDYGNEVTGEGRHDLL